MSGKSISKCGQPGHDSSRCRIADYPDCSRVGSADLSQLISYNKHGLSIAEPGLDRRKFRQPNLRQIRDIDWSKFSGVSQICRQGNAWFAAVERRPVAAPELEEALVPAGREEPKGLFDRIFDPISEALDLFMEGRSEAALETLGWERAAGLAAAGIAGIAIIISLIRLPIKSAKKRRVARERAEASQAEQRLKQEEDMRRAEVEEARAMAEAADKRAAQAEAAVHEAVRAARELAATREPSPTPQPLELLRGETPIPLVVQPGRQYSAGRIEDRTDPNLVTMLPSNVDFNVIEAVIDIKGDPRLEIENQFGFEIKLSEIKKAALLAQAFPLEGKSLVEATTEYLAIASVFERGGADSLSERALFRAAGYLSQDKVTSEAAAERLVPYRGWLDSGEVQTEAYREYMNFKRERMTLVPGGAEVTPDPVTRRVEPEQRVLPPEPETARVPPPAGAAAGQLQAAAPRPAATSATIDVPPEALARGQPVVFSGEAGNPFFSPDELNQIGEGLPLEFRAESTPRHDSPRFDSSRVMQAAVTALAAEGSPYAALPESRRSSIANFFADAVEQVPEFGRRYFNARTGVSGDGLRAIADVAIFIESDSMLQTLDAAQKLALVRHSAKAFACSPDYQRQLGGGVTVELLMSAGGVASAPLPAGRAPGRLPPAARPRSGPPSDSFNRAFGSDSMQRLLTDVKPPRKPGR